MRLGYIIIWGGGDEERTPLQELWALQGWCLTPRGELQGCSYSKLAGNALLDAIFYYAPFFPKMIISYHRNWKKKIPAATEGLGGFLIVPHTRFRWSVVRRKGMKFTPKLDILSFRQNQPPHEQQKQQHALSQGWLSLVWSDVHTKWKNFNC